MADSANCRSPNYDEIIKIIKTNHANRREPPAAAAASAATDQDPSDSSSEAYYSSPDDEQDFLEQQFSETYENFHTERLNSMSKSELVQQNMALEERVDDLQKRLHQVTHSAVKKVGAGGGAGGDKVDDPAAVAAGVAATGDDEPMQDVVPDSSSRDSDDNKRW